MQHNFNLNLSTEPNTELYPVSKPYSKQSVHFCFVIVLVVIDTVQPQSMKWSPLRQRQLAIVEKWLLYKGGCG